VHAWWPGYVKCTLAISTSESICYFWFSHHYQKLGYRHQGCFPKGSRGLLKRHLTRGRPQSHARYTLPSIENRDTEISTFQDDSSRFYELQSDTKRRLITPRVVAKWSSWRICLLPWFLQHSGPLLAGTPNNYLLLRYLILWRSFGTQFHHVKQAVVAALRHEWGLPLRGAAKAS